MTTHYNPMDDTRDTYARIADDEREIARDAFEAARDDWEGDA